MQWIHSIRRGRRFSGGRAAWTSAGSPRSASWRWHARPFGDWLTRPCPLLEICPMAEKSYWPLAILDLEAGPANAGSLAFWPIGEDSTEG